MHAIFTAGVKHRAFLRDTYKTVHKNSERNKTPVQPHVNTRHIDFD